MEIKHCHGFSLIEVVVGLFIMSIAVVGIMGIFFSYNERMTDPVFEVKSALLADRIFNNIYRVSYDENSDHSTGECRCGETVALDSGENVCGGVTCSSAMGPDSVAEANAVNLFDDADDFDTDGLCGYTGFSGTCKQFNGNEACGASNSTCKGVEATFFVSHYKDMMTDLKNEGIYNASDAGYDNFYVVIKVNENNISVSGKNYGTAKSIYLSVISPRGDVFRYNGIRGNY